MCQLRPDDQYNARVVSYVRSTHPTSLALLLAALVAAFVALYPLLDCGPEGCPEVSQSSYATSAGASASFSAMCCPLAVTAAIPAALAFASFRGRRPADDHPRLVGLRLSPDPPPPRIHQAA